MSTKKAILMLLVMCSMTCLANTQPNILWIVTDDQRADSLAIYNKITSGQSNSRLGYVESPNIDSLAEEGAIFINAYANSPACAPSRASMISGMYPHRSGRYGFEFTHNSHDRAVPMLPQLLKKDGYQTAQIGKDGLYIFKWDGKPMAYDIEVGFDTHIHHKNSLAKYGFGEFYSELGPAINGEWPGREEKITYPNGKTKTYWLETKSPALFKTTAALKKEVEQDLDILRSYTRSYPHLILGGQNPLPAGDTVDGNLVKVLREYFANADNSYTSFINQKIKGPQSDKPLMIHLGFSWPHTPVLPPKSFRERFKNKKYKIPEFSLDEVKSMPAQLKDLYIEMTTKSFTPAEKQQMISDYYAYSAYGDSLLGEAVKAFKDYSKKHKHEYLIVVTAGDHGWHLGEQGIAAKFGPWQESSHGVLIVVSSDKKQFPPGSIYKEFVEYVDIAPTLYAAAGGEGRQKHFDGYNLADILKNKAPKRDYVISEMNQVVGPRANLRSKHFSFSMRNRPFDTKPGDGFKPGQDILWVKKASDKEVEMVLYDLREDPLERKNVAYDPKYKEVAKFLRKKLGDITVGDGRIEVDWNKKSRYQISNYAKGADDKRLPDLTKLVAGQTSDRAK